MARAGASQIHSKSLTDKLLLIKPFSVETWNSMGLFINAQSSFMNGSNITQDGWLFPEWITIGKAYFIRRTKGSSGFHVEAKNTAKRAGASVGL